MRFLLARRPIWTRFFSNPSQRLVGVFLIFILLPGTVLGVFALRVLRQEEQLLKQRNMENLERIANEIGRELESEFRRWDESVGLAAESGISSVDSLPEFMQEAFKEPGDGILLSRSVGNLSFFPAGALLFSLDSLTVEPSSAISLSSGFIRAESLEIKQKDYSRAVLAYRNLLESAKPEMRAILLHRLARTLGKAGRYDEAADTYRNLQSMDPVLIGGWPSDLIGRSELCALAVERGDMSELGVLSLSLYRDLVGGKWLLDEPRYSYYADRCRPWCRDSQVQTEEFARLQKLEENKLLLTRAAKRFLNEPSRVKNNEKGTHFCFWGSDPFAAVVLSENALRRHWWPRILTSKGEDIESVLITSDGHVLFGSADGEEPPFAVVQNLSIDGMTWGIQVWPGDPDVIQREVRQRQFLFLGILVFIGALLIFGSYVTVRMVRRELEISRMRADFVSTVSHEFRSPLTGIRQLGDMLLHGRAADKKKQKQYFKMIVQESDRLTRLVENILDFTRMEEGKKEFNCEPLDTSQWLSGLAADFVKEITTEGVILETSIPGGLPVISADSEVLGSAVHNLLDNAVKYSPGEKVVWLDAEDAGEEVRIAVRDKGVGISESDQKHIFSRFYRADGDITARIKGAGLGLNLVQHIVAAHNGRVECQSKVGEGSTFTIWIPALPTMEGG
jgi:signal transduction histidine kinase